MTLLCDVETVNVWQPQHERHRYKPRQYLCTRLAEPHLHLSETSSNPIDFMPLSDMAD